MNHPFASSSCLNFPLTLLCPLAFIDHKLRAVLAGDSRRTRPRHAQLETIRHVRQPDRAATHQ